MVYPSEFVVWDTALSSFVGYILRAVYLFATHQNLQLTHIWISYLGFDDSNTITYKLMEPVKIFLLLRKHSGIFIFLRGFHAELQVSHFTKYSRLKVP